MKLLLTSSGITNKSISKALFELVDKEPENTSILVIPTASNYDLGDKEWYIDDLINIKNQNFKQIDIADISSSDKDIWTSKINQADIIFFEGGNSFYLMNWIIKSGLINDLPKILETKVYVGVSAGSMVTNPDLLLKPSQLLYEEDLEKTENINGLNYVNFYFLPHYNSKWFKNLRKENIDTAVEGITTKIYAIDDNGAIKVNGDKIEIVTEGEYLEYN